MKSLLLLIAFLPMIALGQSDAELWSTWKSRENPDSVRLKAVAKIAWGLLFENSDSAYLLAKEQEEFALEAKSLKMVANAYNTQAASFYVRGDYKEAVKLYDLAFETAQKANDLLGQAQALGNKGIVLKNQGNYQGAMSAYVEALRIHETRKDTLSIAIATLNIGGAHSDQGEYEVAIQYYQKAAKLYYQVGEYIKYGNALSNIGIAYKKLNDYSLSRKYVEQALEVSLQNNDSIGIQIAFSNLSSIESELGNLNKALDYAERAIRITENLDFSEVKIQTQAVYADILLKSGEIEKAIQIAEEGLSAGNKIGAYKLISMSARVLHFAYKKQGNYAKSLAAFEQFTAAEDSLKSVQNQKEVIRQQYKYEYETQAAADSVKSIEAAKIKDAQLETERADNRRQRVIIYFVIALTAIIIFFVIMVLKSLRQVRVEKVKVDAAYDELEEKNTEILDSISYAKRIQSAILPPQKLIKEYLPDSFILYKPKDIVAGDFYWLEHKDNQVLFAACDCTGHGVPGAMVSVVCNNGLNRAVREHGLTDPGKILDKTREIVIAEFEKSEEEVKDGMDVALCSIEGNTLQYAGAHNPLWIIRSGANEVQEIKANKQPIGKYDSPLPYQTHEVELSAGDTIYIFSDGYADQFGGEKGKKFKATNFKRLLLSIQDNSMEQQKQLINNTFESWRGEIEQVDDVCIIGFRA